MKFNRNKIISISIIGLAVLLSIGGGVYYFVDKNNQQKQLSAVSSQYDDYSNLTQKQKSDLLVEFAKIGNLNQFRKLIESGADINAKDINGITPLIAASRSGQIEIVRELTSFPADINAKDTEKESTAMIEASRNGYPNVVYALLQVGADINAKDINGVTPLIAASTNNHLDTVKFLIFSGADINAKDSNNNTALTYATNNGYLEIVDELKYPERELSTDSEGHALKTYKNSNLGFKFDYPVCAGCEIKEITKGISLGSVAIFILDSNKLNLSDFVNKDLEQVNNLPNNGLKLFNRVIDGENAIEANYFDIGSIYIKKNDKIYKILLGYGADTSCCNDVTWYYGLSTWDTIISTFNFTTK